MGNNLVHKILILISFIFISFNCFSNQVYTYKNETTKSIILTNKKSDDPNFKLVKTIAHKDNTSAKEDRRYSDLMSAQTGRSRTVLAYKMWIEEGRLGIPPLIADKVYDQVVFSPITMIYLMSGNGLIDSDYVALDYSYKDYDTCMKAQNKNVAAIKKEYKFKLYSGVKYPKNTIKKYQYLCKSRIIEVRTPVMNEVQIQNDLDFIRSYEKRRRTIVITPTGAMEEDE